MSLNKVSEYDQEMPKPHTADPTLTAICHEFVIKAHILLLYDTKLHSGRVNAFECVCKAQQFSFKMTYVIEGLDIIWISCDSLRA